MKFIFFLIPCFFILDTDAQSDRFEVRKIYASDEHNAFTSMIRFKDSYYCAFRSGERHVYGKDGVSRIMVSPDAIKWKESTIIEKEGVDLRDPKISITPDGRIMALIGGSVYEGKTLVSMHTQVAFSDKSGKKFSAPQPIEINANIRSGRDWLWAVTWYEGTAYGVLYQPESKSSCLVSSVDGIHYDLVRQLELDGRPNEAHIRFDDTGKMYIIHRREEGDQMGYWGQSQAPYVDWNWKKMPYRLGGPDFVILPEGKVLAGSRIYGDEGNYMGLIKGDLSGDFDEIIALPSGGDCSYPSFILEEDKILVSYYSSHEGTADIYLAELKR